MYPSEGDVSWRGAFVKEQVEECRKLAQSKVNDIAVIDVFHIKARVSGGSNFNYVTFFFKLFAKMLSVRYQLIHCHHAFCVFACALFSRKIVYTVHEGELNNANTSPLIKLAIKLSDRVIYVNRKAFTDSVKRKKYFLPCGIDFDRFVPLSEPTRDYILFPADPSRKEKNASLLWQVEKDILREYPNVSFVYGGYIPRDSMPTVMGNALMVISIGDYESDGLVIKEAMALNVPVISTDVGNAKYYLNDKSGIIIENNSSSLKKAISSILKKIENYLNGRKQLLNLHVDNRSTAAKLLDIYEGK
jgi:glycosyltransferase involved in cell wall biosynthesis